MLARLTVGVKQLLKSATVTQRLFCMKKQSSTKFFDASNNERSRLNGLSKVEIINSLIETLPRHAWLRMLPISERPNRRQIQAEQVLEELQARQRLLRQLTKDELVMLTLAQSDHRLSKYGRSSSAVVKLPPRTVDGRVQIEKSELDKLARKHARQLKQGKWVQQLNFKRKSKRQAPVNTRAENKAAKAVRNSWFQHVRSQNEFLRHQALPETETQTVN